MNIRGGDLDSMYYTTVPVYPDMRLITKVPCIGFSGLVRIRILFLFFVLRGGRRRDDCGIRSFLFSGSILVHQHGYHLCEQLPLESMLNQQILKSP